MFLPESGNRASLVDNGTTTSYTRNSLDQYSAVTGLSNPTYDGNGNLKTYKDWTFGYDAMNRLISVTKGTTNTGYFWYDGLGRICTRQINGGYGVRYQVWAGWDLVEDYKMVDDTLDTRYLQGEGTGEMVSITTGGQKYYLYQDGRGNVSQVADSNAMVIETYKYDLNGTPTIYDPSGVQDTDGVSAMGNRIMFGGREYYRELELYNFRNRFYLPELGRFLQADPIGFASDLANLYRYCANNPVNASDPFGLQGLEPHLPGEDPSTEEIMGVPGAKNGDAVLCATVRLRCAYCSRTAEANCHSSTCLAGPHASAVDANAST